VSLTSVACKVMESVIKRVLTEFANDNHLAMDCQHGFRRVRSCLTNLLESFELWTEALDCGYSLDILYLDYRKAFDTVLHCRLILKLQSYGILDTYIKWISSFLTSRMMIVGEGDLF
jgi:Reverse transcriptase (RNA-dependent DNA polymerase)